MKRVHKVQRRTARTRERIAARRRALFPPAANGVRWALASDGAFLLPGTPVEIPRPAARALVEFVRTLDAAEA